MRSGEGRAQEAKLGEPEAQQSHSSKVRAIPRSPNYSFPPNLPRDFGVPTASHGTPAAGGLLGCQEPPLASRHPSRSVCQGTHGALLDPELGLLPAPARVFGEVEATCSALLCPALPCRGACRQLCKPRGRAWEDREQVQAPAASSRNGTAPPWQLWQQSRAGSGVRAGQQSFPTRVRSPYRTSIHTTKGSKPQSFVVGSANCK